MWLLSHTQTTVEIKAWMINYTPRFYAGGISYACPNPDAGLVNVSNRGPLRMNLNEKVQRIVED